MMPCPMCHHKNCKVVDSRPCEFRDKQTIRRRRICARCQYRFTTYEVLDSAERRMNVQTGIIMQSIKRAHASLSELLDTYSQVRQVQAANPSGTGSQVSADEGRTGAPGLYGADKGTGAEQSRPHVAVQQVLRSCPHYPDCGCGTQSGPHACTFRLKKSSGV